MIEKCFSGYVKKEIFNIKFRASIVLKELIDGYTRTNEVDIDQLIKSLEESRVQSSKMVTGFEDLIRLLFKIKE
jgi:hypothetical protein